MDVSASDNVALVPLSGGRGQDGMTARQTLNVLRRAVRSQWLTNEERREVSAAMLDVVRSAASVRDRVAAARVLATGDGIDERHEGRQLEAQSAALVAGTSALRAAMAAPANRSVLTDATALLCAPAAALPGAPPAAPADADSASALALVAENPADDADVGLYTLGTADAPPTLADGPVDTVRLAEPTLDAAPAPAPPRMSSGAVRSALGRQRARRHDRRGAAADGGVSGP